MKNFTFGSDPEMFIFAGDKLIPAFEFLPHKSQSNLYWDGFQAEWKYDQGFETIASFIEQTRERIAELSSLTKKYKPEARLSLKNTVVVSPDILKTAKQEQIELGCMPSFNVYGHTGKIVGDPRLLMDRAAGGHIHIGTWPNKPDYDKIVKKLDTILGVWSVGAAQSIDSLNRRLYYGLAGEHRRPKYDTGYGIEYRTLSNFWLCHPVITEMTLNIAREIVTNPKFNEWIHTGYQEEDISKAIDNCNTYTSKLMLMENSDLFVDIFGFDAYYVGLDGVKAVVDNPHDIEKNWGI